MPNCGHKRRLVLAVVREIGAIRRSARADLFPERAQVAILVIAHLPGVEMRRALHVRHAHRAIGNVVLADRRAANSLSCKHCFDKNASFPLVSIAYKQKEGTDERSSVPLVLQR